MAGIRVEGNTSGYVAEVDVNNNLKVNLPTTLAQAGFAALVTEVDAGTVTGTRNVNNALVTDYRRLKVGVDTLLFHHQFSATAQNTAVWKYATNNSYVCALPGGTLLFNNANTITAASGSFFSSWAHFSLLNGSAFQMAFNLNINALPVANQILEVGLYEPVIGAVPGDGCYVRYSSGGLQLVVNYNTTETVSTIYATALALNTNHEFVVIIERELAILILNEVVIGSIPRPVVNPSLFLADTLPISAQQRNSATATGGTMQAKIGYLALYQTDIQTNKGWGFQMARNGWNHQGMEGGTMGQLAAWVNNTAPTAAALQVGVSLVTGLGGIGAILPTLTVAQDGIVFSYQNPAGSLTQPPRTLVITGVTMRSAISVILAGGPVTYVYALEFGGTTLVQTTAETASLTTATAKAHRHIPLGMETFPVTSAVGVLGAGLIMQFQNPIIVNPGEFVQIIARNMGVVTTTGAITIMATFDHYFE